MSEIEDSRLVEISRDICKLFDYTTNEKVLLKRLEQILSPKPSELGDTKEEVESLEQRIYALAEKMGAPPQLIPVGPAEQESPQYETYIQAAITEILAAFHRCRYDICRVHMFYIGTGIIIEHPDWVNLPMNDVEKANYQKVTESSFWEHTEIAFIRLVSFWDRVGQLLDFITVRRQQGRGAM